MVIIIIIVDRSLTIITSYFKHFLCDDLPSHIFFLYFFLFYFLKGIKLTLIIFVTIVNTISNSIIIFNEFNHILRIFIIQLEFWHTYIVLAVSSKAVAVQSEAPTVSSEALAVLIGYVPISRGGSRHDHRQTSSLEHDQSLIIRGGSHHICGIHH